MTYTAPDVPAPAVNLWDQAGIVTDALAVLRLDAADVDADRVTAAADEATEQLDQLLDRTTELDTTTIPSLHGAAVDVTVSLYRRKDAATGVLASYTPAQYMPVAVDADPLAKVRKMIRPWKERASIG